MRQPIPTVAKPKKKYGHVQLLLEPHEHQLLKKCAAWTGAPLASWLRTIALREARKTMTRQAA
jgi:uncharacterized protein (DUF1778 family)